MPQQRPAGSIFAAGQINPRPAITSPTQGILAPVDFVEAFRRGQDDQTRLQNDGVRETQTLEELWRRHRSIEAAVGRPVPLSQSLVGQPTAQRDSLKNFLERVIPTDQINARILGRPGALTDDAYEQRLDALRREFPDAMQGVETADQIRARLSADWYAIRRRRDDAATSGAAGVAGTTMGGIVGSFQDPVNTAGALLTGGAGAGKSLLTRMLVQGAVGSGLEALGVGDRASDAARYGGPVYSTEDAAADILFGGVGNAGFEVVGDVARVASRPLRSALSGSASPAPVARALAAEIDRASREYARDGAEPGLRAAVQRLEGIERDERIIGPAGGETFEDARQALDRLEPPPVVEPERDLSEIFDTSVSNPLPPTGEMAEATYHGRRILAGRFDPMLVQADPVTFQYKAGGDGEGVTGRLAGVEVWDPTAAGRSLLYERRDGSLVIADGHQRRALARNLIETGRDPNVELDGFLFRQADGWAPEDVRVVAALKNVREGSGSILDAAKVFRDAPELPNDRSLPVSGEFIANARGLARLSPEAFGAVVNDVIPARYGAVLGSMAGDRPDLHESLVDLLRRGSPRSLDDARALVSEGMLADFVEREGMTADLFGGMPAESAIIARAKLRASVLRQLRSDSRLFGSLVRRADAIEVGGNLLARSENEMRVALDSAAVALVDRLALRGGEIGDLFGASARAVARGERSMSEAVGEVVDDLRRVVDESEGLGRFRQDAIAPRAPSAMADDALAPFSDPAGEGARAQLEPKPEDAALEAGDGPGGLFGDLMLDEAEERAFKRLAPCAPGGGS